MIFLDEPTTGLDPRSRRTMWEIIRELAAAGVTILLTTQNLDEADHLAHQIAVLDRGRIVAEGTPAELKSRIPGGHVRFHFADLHEFHSAADLLPAAGPDQDQLVLQVPADDSVDWLPRTARPAAPRTYSCRTAVDPHSQPRRRVLRRYWQPRQRPARPGPHTTRSGTMTTPCTGSATHGSCCAATSSTSSVTRP